MADCPNRRVNIERCTCSYPGCSRKGVCCECIRHHREAGEIPGCLFPKDVERTYDRSARRFTEAIGK